MASSASTAASVLKSRVGVILSSEQCLIAGIEPGAEYESFVSRKGTISIVTKRKGAARGRLNGVAINDQVSDEDSLESVLHE